jgi:hypothetical protein
VDTTRVSAEQISAAFKKLDELPVNKHRRIDAESFGLKFHRRHMAYGPSSFEKYPIIELDFASVFLFHDSLNKGQIIYRLNNLERLLDGDFCPAVIVKEGKNIVTDGNHRVATLALLGFKKFSFHHCS